MRSALRKMGNSTGLILPRPVLEEAGVERGAVVELTVESGRIIVTAVREGARRGWAEAAAQIAGADLSEDEAAWAGFGLEDDPALTW
jgi:antitoxin MazE